jgi:hypothetical protein
MLFRITGSTTIYNLDQMVKATTAIDEETKYLTMTLHFSDGTRLLFNGKAFSNYGYSDIADVTFLTFKEIMRNVDLYSLIKEIKSDKIVELPKKETNMRELAVIYTELQELKRLFNEKWGENKP